MLGRKPHPARFTRYLTAGASSTAFLTLVGAYSVNAQEAQASVQADTVASPSAAPSTTAPTAPATPVAKATPAKKPAAKKAAASKPVKKKSSTKSTTSGSGGTTVKPSPVATNPSVTYTCKSPGGSTKPLRNGSCSYVAQYGYVKVKV